MKISIGIKKSIKKFNLNTFFFSAGFMPITGGNFTKSYIGYKDNNNKLYITGCNINGSYEGGTLELFGDNYDVSSLQGGFSLFTVKNKVAQAKLTGTPDGSLTWNGNYVINSSGITANSNIFKRTVDNNYIVLCGGMSTNDSAYIQAYGKDYSARPGAFQLVARDGINKHDLIGTADGQLIWDTTLLSDIAITAQSLGNNGYICFANKFCIQWAQNAGFNPKNYIDFTPNIGLTKRLSYTFIRIIDAPDKKSYIGDSSNYSSSQLDPTAVFVHEAVGKDSSHGGEYYSNNIRLAFNRQIDSASALQYRLTLFGLVN